ncbi:DNA primase [Mycena sanguinolenta]|uniref:DNA primase n=1 Tax=Mycena sanguinolenta TaxID=230812 RepID=A0A8H7DJT4_9AGAR|nr:DNA primase [Mycena sanguinolenta]
MAEVSREVMGTYYRRLFPFKSTFHWLNHEPTPNELFYNREIAFNLPDDVIVRYQSFNDVDEFKKQVCKLNPTRFEIGPVYTSRPRDRKTTRKEAFNPETARARTSASAAGPSSPPPCVSSTPPSGTSSAGSTSCGCTPAVAGSICGSRIKEAMELTDDQRKAIVNWLTVVPKDESKRVNVRFGSRPLPASLQPALDHLAMVFTELILQDQDCFASEEGAEAFLKLIPDSRVVDSLRTQWESSSSSSEEKWKDLKTEIKRWPKESPQRASLMAAMEDIILQYTYPRLDENVSKKRNHLLKAPFCIHPKTGRVCVPVDPEKIEEFDPEAVPTVNQLIRELDTTAENAEHHSDWERTSLKPYVDMLDRHNQRIMEEVRRDKRGGDMSW